MSTRTTYVPLVSVIVVRDNKQVDALAEYKSSGKAFKFTEDEIEEIKAVHDGNLELVLRSPNDEAPELTDVAQAATSSEPTRTPAGKKAADKDADL